MKHEIIGDNLQIVNIEIGTGEKVYAEIGSFVYKSENVKIESKMKGGVTDAVKRALTQESIFVNEFTSKGNGIIGFGGNMPGKIKMFKLGKNQNIICERGAFLCGEDTIKIEMQFTKPVAGIMGGEGIILQKLVGPGTVFIFAVGDIIEYDLKKGESLEVAAGHLVAFGENVNYDVEYIGGIFTAIFGGQGLMLAKFTGPGKVILQSMNESKLKKQLSSGSGMHSGTKVNIASSLLGGFFRRR